jgi:hypothetical protein
MLRFAPSLRPLCGLVSSLTGFQRLAEASGKAENTIGISPTAVDWVVISPTISVDWVVISPTGASLYHPPAFSGKPLLVRVTERYPHP